MSLLIVVVSLLCGHGERIVLTSIPSGVEFLGAGIISSLETLVALLFERQGPIDVELDRRVIHLDVFSLLQSVE